MHRITRREFTALAAGALAARPALAQDEAIIMRAIPHGGERLPVVGLGTAAVFADDDAATRDAATKVVRALVVGGGRLIDTASVYQDSETVIGKAMAATGLRDKLFIATKLEAYEGGDVLRRSLSRLQTKQVDLLQLHNVRDPAQSLGRFREWKAQGVCRYVGITSTYHDYFDAVEAVVKREKPDFVQIDYSIDNRLAEERILPAAHDAGAAVLTALPFGRARLFGTVRGKNVPDWAAGFAGSWAQFFLKFLISDPRVTAVIPGTSDPRHMEDNLGAQRGRLPSPEERKRMAAFVAAL